MVSLGSVQCFLYPAIFPKSFAVAGEASMAFRFRGNGFLKANQETFSVQPRDPILVGIAPLQAVWQQIPESCHQAIEMISGRLNG